jgi:hypothetical protein
MNPPPVDRKLAARRMNERIRLLVSSLNTVGLTTFGAAFILPRVNDQAISPSVGWILVAIGLHLTAEGLFQFLRSEE